MTLQLLFSKKSGPGENEEKCISTRASSLNDRDGFWYGLAAEKNAI